MATLTLDRPQITRRRLVTNSPRRSPAQNPSAGKLQEVEDRILAAAVAHHPNADRALDRLLDDIEGLPHDHPTRQTTPLRRHRQVERMEDLLMQAVVQSHPHRPCAIARLLSDVVADAAFDDHEFQDDSMIDADPDGLS